MVRSCLRGGRGYWGSWDSDWCSSTRLKDKVEQCEKINKKIPRKFKPKARPKACEKSSRKLQKSSDLGSDKSFKTLQDRFKTLRQKLQEKKSEKI